MNKGFRGEFKREGWVECSCGKERQLVVREESEKLVDLLWALYERSACRTCELLIAQRMDWCPESVAADGGFGACGKPFAHKGRCVPRWTREETELMLALAREQEQRDAQETQENTDR